MRSMILAVVVALAAAACGGGTGSGPDGRIEVVASFFPLAEAAERIGGDGVNVTDLTPPGAEPHDLELTTDAVDAVLDADLVVYVGGGFQPAVEEAVARSEAPQLDLAEHLRGDEAAATGDVHFWLDPIEMSSGVAAIGEEIGAVAGVQQRGDIAARTTAYATEIHELNDELETGLDGCQRDLVVTGHASFGHLARRYGLRQEAVSGLEPEAEPDPRRLAELSDLVRREGVTTIYTEPGTPPDVADTLARETGATVDVLDPIEVRDGSYLDRMRSNLEALRKGLGCP